MFVEIIEDLFADDLLDSEKYLLVFVCDGVVFQPFLERVVGEDFHSGLLVVAVGEVDQFQDLVFVKI